MMAVHWTHPYTECLCTGAKCRKNPCGPSCFVGRAAKTPSGKWVALGSMNIVPHGSGVVYKMRFCEVEFGELLDCLVWDDLFASFA